MRGCLKKAALVSPTAPRGRRLVIAAACFLLLLGVRAQAGPLKIGVLAFQGLTRADTEIGLDIERTIVADLSRGGALDVIGFDPNSLLNFDSATVPRFTDWRTAGAQSLISGRLYRQSDEFLAMEVRLWDVVEGRYLSGVQFVLNPKRWREAAHAIANELYERLTGQSIQFQTETEQP